MEYAEYIVLLSFFMTSLLGSAHCVGMCGGFASLCGGDTARSSLYRASSYHFGRLVTYLIAAQGAKGIHLLGGGYVIGVLLVLAGILLLAGKKIVPASITRAMALMYRKLLSYNNKKSALFPFVLGFSSTLLPCGWLYINLGVATASSYPLLMMVIFWLGTLPFLTAWTTVSSALLAKLGGWYPKIRASLLIAMGLIAVYQHIPLSALKEKPVSRHHHCH